MMNLFEIKMIEPRKSFQIKPKTKEESTRWIITIWMSINVNIVLSQKDFDANINKIVPTSF